MLDCSGRMYKISIEYKIVRIRNPSGICQTERCCIQIEISACIKSIDIPSDTYNYILKSRVTFCKTDLLSFFKLTGIYFSSHIVLSASLYSSIPDNCLVFLPNSRLSLTLRYFNTIMTAECCKSTLESASDGIKLPLSVMSVKFSYNYCCFNGEVLPKIIMDQFHLIGFIYQTDIRV